MKNGWKLVLITLPLVAAGVGILAFLVSGKPPPERKPLTERAAAVRVIIATEQLVSPTVIGFGLASPARTYTAIAQVGGTVEYVNPGLEKGAILPVGSVLFRLSPADYDLAIAQAHANIRATRARLTELTVSGQNQAAALEIENKVLILKQQDLARVESLFSGGTVSQNTLATAKSAALAQRQKVLSIESTLALLPTQREVQKQQVAVYQANLSIANLNLSRTELTLPFSARVASVSVEVGQYLGVGKTGAVLDGIDAAEVVVQVSAATLRTLLRPAHPDAAGVSPDPASSTGMLQDLLLDAEVQLQLGQELVRWPARLDRISDTIDQQAGTVGVILRVDTAYSSARPGERPPLAKGMFVKVILRARPVPGIVVPRSALRNGQLMIAGDDDRLSLIQVTPYLVQGAIALIGDGLQQGQRVVVSDLGPGILGMLLDVTQDTDLMARLADDGWAK